MKRSVLVLSLVCMWGSHDVTHAFDPKRIKTEVGMAVLSSQWLSLSHGLRQWPDSRYYRTSLSTRFYFNRAWLFNLKFALRYNRIGLSYGFITNSLPLETYSSTYKTQLQEVDGTFIHPLRGHSIKEYRLAISYEVAKNTDILGEAFLSKRGVAGGYEGTIYEFNPLSGIQLRYKNEGLGIGLDVRRKVGLAHFLILGRLSVVPYVKWSYTYQSTNRIDFHTRRMEGWSGYLHAGIGYQWGNLMLRVAYQPEFYQTYDRSIRDKFKKIELGVAYSF